MLQVQTDLTAIVQTDLKETAMDQRRDRMRTVPPGTIENVRTRSLPSSTECRPPEYPWKAVEPDRFCQYRKFWEGFYPKAATLKGIYHENGAPVCPECVARLQAVRYLADMPPHGDIARSGSRRFYIDFGANAYETSVTWFQQNYPMTFDHIIAFEADLAKGPAWKEVLSNPDIARKVEFHNMAVGTENGTAILTDHSYSATIVNADLSSRTGSVKESSEEGATPVIDAIEFLRTRVTKDDFVVLKMDIENSEYALIPAMIDSGVLGLMDEMFIECHYTQLWNNGPHDYQECLDLMIKVNDAGVWTHEWR